MMTLNTARCHGSSLILIINPNPAEPSADCIPLRLFAVSSLEMSLSTLLSALMAVSLHLEAVPGHTVVLLGSVVHFHLLHVTASSTGGTLCSSLIAHLPSPGCLVSAFRPHSVCHNLFQQPRITKKTNHVIE